MVTADRPASLALRLRIPSWLASAPTVKINGRTLEASASPGSYLTLSRTWKTGDRVDLELPMDLAVEAMPDDPKTQTFLYGPLVLAGDLGSEGLTEKLIVGPSAPSIRRLPAIDIPTFRATNADPASWIKADDKPLTFHTTGQKKDVALAPISSLFNTRYSVYWQVGS